MKPSALLVLRLKKLAAGLSSPRAFKALTLGVGLSVEHGAAFAGVPAFATVVDVGANRGQFSLFARRRWPTARIIALEPLAEARAVFDAIFKGDHRVTLLPFAAGAQNGSATINITAEDDSSSLLPPGALQTSLYGTTVERTRSIEVRRLDALVTPADLTALALLKIDVQGFELKVLEGAGDLLARFSHIYVECSFIALYEGQALADEVIAFLQSRGFAEVGRFNPASDGRGGLAQADILFKRLDPA